jgi:serine/threonine protein kinase
VDAPNSENMDALRTSSASGEQALSADVPTPGSLIAGRFELESVLGQGGMGVVFAAIDQRMGGRPVAIKWLRGGPQQRVTESARLAREAAALAAIRHPNVVQVYDLDLVTPFLVMERLEGESLATRIAREAYRVEEAVDVLLAVLRGVAAAHDRGLVHRDLKPANVFLAMTSDGELVPKVLDFGIAKWNEVRTRYSQAHTDPRLRLGTPHFMAPEQVHGQAVDARTDVYALGVTLYRMVTGRLPHEGNSLASLFERILAGAVAPARSYQREVPSGLERALQRAMAIDPAHRFADARAFARALRPYGSRHASRRRASLQLGSAILGAAVALLVALAMWTTLRTPARVVSFPPPLPRVRQQDAAHDLPSYLEREAHSERATMAGP